ncbi:MAG: hypothetical protein ACLFOY_12460 [Desulfatibacillaceae bacterium]
MITLFELVLLIFAGVVIYRIVAQNRPRNLPPPKHEDPDDDMDSGEVDFITARMQRKRDEITRLKAEIEGLEAEIQATETLAELKQKVAHARDELRDMERRLQKDDAGSG